MSRFGEPHNRCWTATSRSLATPTRRATGSRRKATTSTPTTTTGSLTAAANGIRAKARARARGQGQGYGYAHGNDAAPPSPAVNPDAPQPDIGDAASGEKDPPDNGAGGEDPFPS